MKNVEKVLHEFVDSGKIVGASILVAQHGKVIIEKQAGFADREAKKPVTENTLFRLASMTKPITSAAAMALVEKGVIGLDTLITEWLPNFTPKSPDGTVGKITVRHLLTHTSGLSYGFVSPDNEPYYSAGVSVIFRRKFKSFGKDAFIICAWNKLELFTFYRCVRRSA